MPEKSKVWEVLGVGIGIGKKEVVIHSNDTTWYVSISRTKEN